MKTLIAQLGFAAALAMFALPSVAAADAVVPPGNSAVNQYTETLPTGGGAKSVKKQGKGDDRSPAQVLGSRNTRRLVAAGPQGREVAEVVAATAPPAAAPAGEPHGTAAAPRADGPKGSSGFDQVIAEAVGTSDSGELGLLLPILIFAILVGSAIVVARRRRAV